MKPSIFDQSDYESIGLETVASEVAKLIKSLQTQMGVRVASISVKWHDDLLDVVVTPTEATKDLLKVFG